MTAYVQGRHHHHHIKKSVQTGAQEREKEREGRENVGERNRCG